MLGFPVEAFGLSWWFDTSALDPPLADRLRELWSRAVPVDELGELAEPGEVGRSRRSGQSAAGRLPFLITPTMPTEPTTDVAVIPEAAESVPYAVSRAFTLAGIRRRTGQALMLHAVGVAAPSGDLVAMVGKSGTGKTTAATHLARRLGYVTDETVVIESDLRVSPYPKPLSIITDPEATFAKTEHSPDELDLLTAPTDVRLGAVVVLVRDPDEQDARLEAIGLVEAALAVLPETSALPTLDDPLRLLAIALTRHGGPYRLVYSEIDQCLDAIAGLASADSERDQLAPTWTHHRGVPDVDVLPAGDDDIPTPEWSAHVRRAPFSDAIVSEGEVLLLRGNLPVSLAGLGAQLWLAAEEPIGLGELHRHAVAAIGPHPHSEQLVVEAAQSLLREALLEVIGPGEASDPVVDEVRPLSSTAEPAGVPGG